jgi:hypothetical protein
MNRPTLKTSTIFIGVRKGTTIYRSIQEVPPRLRKRLLRATAGANSVSLLIADEKGRDELQKAVAARVEALAATAKAKRRMRLRHWIEIITPGAIGLLIWLAATGRWAI